MEFLRRFIAGVTSRRVNVFRRGMYKALFHEVWHEPLIDAISPQPSENMLVLGPNSIPLTITLAGRFPESRFASVEYLQDSIEKGREKAGDLNVDIHPALSDQHLPFAALTFDKVILALALYKLTSQQKLACVREVRRTLRRNGMLFAADFDKPTGRGEAHVFNTLTRSEWDTAGKAHSDGSWVDIFVEAGFKNVRTLSTHSVQFGRVALLRTRKI